MNVLWKDENLPPIISMVSTGLLTDGSPGDVSTYVSSIASTSFGTGCAQHYADAYLTAVSDMEGLSELHTWRFTARSQYDNGDNIVCSLPDLDPGSGSSIVVGNFFRYWVERANSDQMFIPVTSGTLTAGGGFQTVTGSFSSGTSGQYVRVRLHAQIAFWDANDTISATGTLSDFRLSASEPAPELPPTYNTFGLTDDYEILIFGPDGKRKTLPMHLVGTADYSINNKGGYDSFSFPVAATYGEFTEITHGDRVLIWYRGLCRFDGNIRTIIRSEKPGQADVLTIAGFGLWQRIASIPTEKEYIFQESQDIATFAAAVATDYILPLYPDLEVAFDQMGVTSRNIDTRGKTVGEIYDQLLSLVADRAAYGIDRNPETGKRRIYLRNLGTSHFDSTQTPTHVLHPATHSFAFVDSDSREETGELVTRLRVRGIEPKYPNYLPNASFEDVTFSGEQTGNLIPDGSFEATSLLGNPFWDTTGGASLKRSGGVEGYAYEGRYMGETDNPGETITSKFYIETGISSGRAYDFSCYARRELGYLPSTGSLSVLWYNASNILVQTDSLVIATPTALYQRFTCKVACPSGATKAKIRLAGVSGNVYWDNLSLVWDSSVRQVSWRSDFEAGANGRVSWANQEAYHGGYSIYVEKTNDTGQLKIDSTAKMPSIQTQQVRLGGWFKQPAVISGGITDIPEMFIGIREWNMEGRLVGFWEYPCPVTGYSNWTNVETIHTYSSDYDDQGRSQFYLRFNTQGVMLCDALYVRDAASSPAEPYLPDGNYMVNLSTTGVFSATGETTLYNADATYGPGFATVDIDRDNYEDAVSFARLYFASYALPIKKPAITITNYPTIVFPGETVYFPAQDILDTEQPIVSVQETIDTLKVLTSRITINRDRPTVENILKRMKRQQSFASATSLGFTSVPNTSVGAGDAAFPGGSVTSVEGLNGAIDLIGQNIGIGATGSQITLTNEGVISLNSLSGEVTLSAGENITLTSSGNTLEIAAIALTTDSTFAYINDGGVQENETFGNQMTFIMWSQNANCTLAFGGAKVIWIANGRPDHGTLTVSVPAGSLGGSWNLAYEETGVFVAFDIGGGDYDVRRFL